MYSLYCLITKAYFVMIQDMAGGGIAASLMTALQTQPNGAFFGTGRGGVAILFRHYDRQTSAVGRRQFFLVFLFTDVGAVVLISVVELVIFSLLFFLGGDRGRIAAFLRATRLSLSFSREV